MASSMTNSSLVQGVDEPDILKREIQKLCEEFVTVVVGKCTQTKSQPTTPTPDTVKELQDKINRLEARHARYKEAVGLIGEKIFHLIEDVERKFKKL